MDASFVIASEYITIPEETRQKPRGIGPSGLLVLIVVQRTRITSPARMTLTFLITPGLSC